MIPSFFLENGSLYFYANWKKYSSFICKHYSRKKTFGGVAMVIILSQYLKLRETYWKITPSQDMTLVTSHVVPNIFFGKGSIHKRNVKMLNS